MSVQLGEPAPDFELSDQHGQSVRLSDYRGSRPVTLVFFPLAFSSTCQGELCELRDNIGIFQDEGVQLIGVSVDSKHSLRVWSEQQGFDFPLLADFWPHGEVARQYGVFLEDKGFANRGTFLIDADGILRAAFVTEPGRPRELGAYREALAAL